MTDDWFEPPEDRPSDRDDSRFLARLRERAADLVPYGVRAADTYTIQLFDVCVIVSIPGLEDVNLSELQVAYRMNADQARGQHLPWIEGHWGSDYLFDERPFDASSALADEDADPEALADSTADWFILQLARPVVREEWHRSGRVVRTRTVLTDSGVELDRTGRWYLTRKRPPDEVVRIRN